MAQFYTKERSVQGASPQIYDDSKRILTEAENLIESMRAVSSIEERQNAALINNLRSHRQREKELNTRNHQMLMDNMKQVAEVQQQNDRTANADQALKRQQDIEQEQRTMETLATLSQAAGKAAGSMVTQGIAEARANMQAQINEQHQIQQRVPPAKDGEGLAHDVQLAIDRQAEVGSLTTASLAKNAGKDMNFVAGIFVNSARLEREATQLLSNDLAGQIERGKLEDIIRQDPTKVVSYIHQGQVVERPLGDVLQGKIQSSEELNRIYTTLNDELFAELKEGKDPALFLKDDERTRNYINTRVLRYGDKLSNASVERYNSTKLQGVLLGDSPEQLASNSVQYITESGLNPTVGHANALGQITTSVLPNVPSPMTYARAMGEREFKHMPGVKIKDTPFGTGLLIEAQRIEAQKQTQYDAQQKQLGKRRAIEYLSGAISDGTTFSTAEYKRAAKYSQELLNNQSITFEEKLAFDTQIEESYTQKRDNKAVIAELDELADTSDLSKVRIENEYRAGNIDKDTADRLNKEVDVFSNLKFPDGKAISSDSIKSVIGTVADRIVKLDAVTGMAKSYTSNLVKAQLPRIFKAKVKELSQTLADPDIIIDQATLSTIEWINSLPTIPDEDGVTHFRDYHTSFTQTKFPKAPTRTAEDVGHELRGDGVARLDDPNYKVIDVNVPAYQRQIESGQPLKPTAYDQGVADAAGIPFHELLNRRFKALKIQGVEATEGSFGILRRESFISPGVQRLLDGPKTFGKISSATDRTPNVLPARMGNQALGFHNASSIARKFNHPNPELIGALWSLQTKNGDQQPDLTPAQQITQIIENNPNLNMFIPYAELASRMPEVVPIMRQYGDSHSTFSGASKSISRLQNTLAGQPSRLSRAIIGKESTGNPSATNRDSGALGYGQVLPSNVPTWSKEALGFSMTPQEFLDNPREQVKVVNFKIKQYYDKALSEGNTPDVALRKAAAAWYAGPGNTHLYDDDKPQFSNGNEYPSIRSYTLDILRRYKNE